MDPISFSLVATTGPGPPYLRQSPARANTIIAINLNGATLKQVLAQGARPLVAGLERADAEWIESASGRALVDENIYRVLVNSFMYAGSDNYEGIAAANTCRSLKPAQRTPVTWGFARD